MRNTTSGLLTLALLSCGTGLFFLGHAAKVRAQTVFCPSTVSIPGVPGTGITFQNGLCTNGRTGAFSGAAVASQALSELSETTTQETTRNAVKSIAARSRKGALPRRIFAGGRNLPSKPTPVSEAAPVVPAGPPEEHALKKTKKTKAAAIRREEAPEAKSCIVRSLRLRSLPIPIEPAVRIGTWIQVYGDYAKRDETGPTTVPINNFYLNPGQGHPIGLDPIIQSRTGTVGFLFGADLTSRGVISENEGLIAGL